MMVDSLAAALVGHLAGDYLLQNDWMAQGKKRSSLICLVHVAIYTACVTVAAQWWTWWIPLVVAVPHFAIDRTQFVRWYMRTVGQEKSFMQPPMAPWSFIAVDNSMHAVCLLATALLVKAILP